MRLRWLGVCCSIAGCATISALEAPPSQQSCDGVAAPGSPKDSPTDCDVLGSMRAIEPYVSDCAREDGLVRLSFQFKQPGMVERVVADLGCERCQRPAGVDESVFLRCVERAAAIARLNLPPEQPTYELVYLFRLWIDPRLKGGWSPMDRGTH